MSYKAKSLQFSDQLLVDKSVFVTTKVASETITFVSHLWYLYFVSTMYFTGRS